MKADCLLSEECIHTLLQAAREGKKRSYSPYSHYPVGAAVLTEEGHIFQGCNVENTSYPAGFCAEQNAIGSAIAAGHRTFLAIAVVGEEKKETLPCGICRQVLFEFHVPYVICGTENGYHVYTLKELLPYAFEIRD